MQKLERITSIALIVCVVFILSCNKRLIQSKNNKSIYAKGFIELVQNAMILDGGNTYFHFVALPSKISYRGKGQKKWNDKYELKKQEKKVIFSFKEGWSSDETPLIIDSLSFVKSLLNYMIVGGTTSFSYPNLTPIPIGKNSDMYMPPNHRIDLILYYYIYYGFYAIEEIPKNTFSINLIDTIGNRTIYCSTLDTMLVGNPDKLYPKLPVDPCNDKLHQIHECFKRWIKKVELLGWEKAKEQKLSPFNDCSCRMEFVLPPK